MKKMIFALAILGRIGAAQAEEWYEGGTLHQKTMTEWCIAYQADRLATAADFVAGADQKGYFTETAHEKLRNPENFKTMAMILVRDMNKAACDGTQPLASVANTAVSDVAGMTMIFEKWISPDALK